MDFKVIITQAALNDLENIVDYISQDDPRAAQRVATDLVKRAESLAEMPRRGKSVRARPLVRNPYLIIYQVDEAAQMVKVLRFWHGAREPRSLRLD
ncbi:type II toxin-antitoxin system RelE/ParE family toxin [Verrucomicrobiota bacterium sgz303538]